MGIDFLDVGLRIEKHFKIQVRQADWESLARDKRPPDITVGDLFDLVESRLICRKCEYDLRGHPNTGICPECGSEFAFNDRTRQIDWEAFRQLLAESLDLEPDEISRESLLIRDLGMS
jgi:acyl carrier protein